MASYWAYTSTGTNYWIYLIVENVDQDIANNRSKVRYKAYLEGASSTSSWGTGSYTVTINGASTSGSIQYDFSSAKKWYCIGSDSGYRTSGFISHNNDGTKSITVSFNFSGASLVGSATISETFTLNTIPRASDVAVSNYTVANTTGSISATITSKANFYHRWRWKVGSGSWSGWNNKGLIATTSSTVTVSNSNLLSRMPNDKSGTFTIEVATYSDSSYSTHVGTKSASSTLTVTIKPSVSLGNIAINTSPISGYAVAGYSTVKATWSATPGSGASNGTTYFSISTGSVTASSSTASSGTVTSTTIPGSASNYTLTITAYTVDSRGLRSDNVSKSITVYGYQPPTATLSAYRVATSTSTKEDGAGVYVYVTFSGAVRSTVNSKNSVQSTTCTYSGSISGTATNGQHIALADSQSATFTLTVTDKVTSSTTIVSVAPALYPLDLYDNGQGAVGVGFGTTAIPYRVTSALSVFVGESFMSAEQVQVGSVTHNGNTYNGCHSLAGKIFLRCAPTATDIKALSTMNHSGAYKDIISVDQNNNATFHGNAETSTYSTNANNANNAQRLRSYNFDSGDSACYVKLGTLTTNFNAKTTEIIIYTGQGFNANVQQNGWARVQIKNAWQSTASATGAFGITYQVFGFQMENFEVVGIATDYQTIEVWAYIPWGYGAGNYVVMGYFENWAHDGTTKSTSVPSGTQQPRAKIYSDESIVLWSGTLQGGNIISLADVAKYCRVLKIYAQSYAGSIVFEMDLIHASTNTSTAGNVYARTGVSIHIATVSPETHYCECEVVRNKNQFYCRNMGFIVGTTNNARNNNSSYFVYKIEGIL